MGIGVMDIRDDTRQELGRVLLMQLAGYDGKSELRRQVVWNVEVAAEPGPEVCKSADNGRQRRCGRGTGCANGRGKWQQIRHIVSQIVRRIVPLG